MDIKTDVPDPAVPPPNASFTAMPMDHLRSFKLKMFGIKESLQKMLHQIDVQREFFSSLKEEVIVGSVLSLDHVQRFNEFFNVVSIETHNANSELSAIEDESEIVSKDLEKLQGCDTCGDVRLSDSTVFNISEVVDDVNLKSDHEVSQENVSHYCNENTHCSPENANCENNLQPVRKVSKTRKLYKCHICLKVMKKLKTLVRHVEVVHESNAKFECKYCFMKFKNKNLLKTHMKVEHVDSDKTPLEIEKQSNVISKLEEIKFEHESLNEVGGQATQAKTNGRKQIYKCDQCDKSFSCQSYLKKHQSTHSHSDHMHHCDKCDRKFQSLYSLKKHLKRHNTKTDLKCSWCENQFVSKLQLNSHIDHNHQNKSEVKVFMCEVCGVSFKTNSNLSGHMKVHTGEKPYTCTTCQQSFRTRRGLVTHSRRHTGERPFQCVKCGQTFMDMSNLGMHMKRHTGIKPHQCDQCPLRFYLKSELKNHMKTHSSERPFQCMYCPATFKHSSLKILHTRIHTGERPYECKICEKRFKDLNSLKDHNGIHTGLRYNCLGCGQSYARKWGLTLHLRNHHETCGKIPHFTQKKIPSNIVV